MTKKYFNFINGSWKEALNGNTIESRNPAAPLEAVGNFQSSSKEDLSEAIIAADQSFEAWSSLSYIERGSYLYRAAEEMEKIVEEIAETATKEMGKTFIETKGEVKRSIAILKYYAGEGMQQIGEVIPSADSETMLYTKRVPLGAVGIIAPWNFPIAIPIWKIAPALIYGNTVVFKPASESAITGLKIVEVFEKAGLPAGVLNAVTGKGSIIGEGLVENDHIKGISFTGSNPTGKRIAIGAVERGIKYQLEMGGKNPSVILEDADLDQASKMTVDAAMKHTGQKCTATSRVYIQESIYEKTKEKIIKHIEAIKVGNGMDEDTYMGPVATKSQYDSVLAYIEKGKKEGAKLIYEGKSLTNELREEGFYIEPTVFEDGKEGMAIVEEEIFGPVIVLMKTSGLQDAITKANSSRFGLSAAVFTNNIKNSVIFSDKVDAGMIKVNGETTGSEPHVPFGGMKDSSSHSREQGKAAKEFFTSIKTISTTI